MHCYFLSGLYPNVKHANLIVVEDYFVGLRTSSHFFHVLCESR